jgi:hypothetical protein
LENETQLGDVGIRFLLCDETDIIDISFYSEGPFHDNIVQKRSSGHFFISGK